MFQRTRNRPFLAGKFNNNKQIEYKNMKKTLITLLALGGLAMGSVTWDNMVIEMDTSQAVTTTTGELTNSRAITVALTLDVNTLAGYLVTSGSYSGSKQIVNLYPEQENKHAIGSVDKHDSNATSDWTVTDAGIFGSWNISTGGGAYNYDLGYDDLPLETANFWDNVSAAAIALSKSSGTESCAILTLKFKNGSVVTYGGTEITNLTGSSYNATNVAIDTNLVTSGYIFDGYASKADMIAITSAMVPEPTTATLSLLALAGLAARRRRH